MNQNQVIRDFASLLKKDKEWRHTFLCNIAMPFKDHYASYRKKTGKQALSNEDIHKVATDSAEWFIKLLCDEIKFPKNH